MKYCSRESSPPSRSPLMTRAPDVDAAGVMLGQRRNEAAVHRGEDREIRRAVRRLRRLVVCLDARRRQAVQVRPVALSHWQKPRRVGSRPCACRRARTRGWPAPGRSRRARRTARRCGPTRSGSRRSAARSAAETARASGCAASGPVVGSSRRTTSSRRSFSWPGSVWPARSRPARVAQTPSRSQSPWRETSRAAVRRGRCRR